LIARRRNIAWATGAGRPCAKKGDKKQMAEQKVQPFFLSANRFYGHESKKTIYIA
jgi:hypothetical protein